MAKSPIKIFEDKNIRIFLPAMTCTVSPFSLAELSAFAISENGVEWKDRELDELTKETILKLSPHCRSLDIGLRRGRPNDYVVSFERFIGNFHFHLQTPKNDEELRTFIFSFYGRLPTPDVLRKTCQKTRGQLLNIFLFWEFSLPEFIPDEFFSAMCE